MLLDMRPVHVTVRAARLTSVPRRYEESEGSEASFNDEDDSEEEEEEEAPRK